MTLVTPLNVMRKSDDFSYNLICMFSTHRSPVETSFPSSMCLISNYQMDIDRNGLSSVCSKCKYFSLDTCHAAIVDSFLLHNTVSKPDLRAQSLANSLILVYGGPSLHLDLQYLCTPFPSISIQLLTLLYLAS